MKEKLLNNFIKIANIPRKSGNEEKIADFFVQKAKEYGLEFYKDDFNDVLIKKRGNISSNPIALQAHLDMVCVKKTDSNHDFERDGITVLVNGDEVTAKDTSLGADQGVGLAIMLTIMEDNTFKHPDLEFIFTSEEETTFKGVVNFPYDKLSSKRMINLDNANDQSVIIGSDGDICNKYIFKGNLVDNDFPNYKVVLKNFPGGNSGDNIDLSANNAIITMARLLIGKDIVIRCINGGTAENDLAQSCEVILGTKLNLNELFKDYNVEINPVNNNSGFSKDDTQKILKEILDLGSGYIDNKKASANIGLIATNDSYVEIIYIFRSSDRVMLDNLNEKTKRLNNDFEVKEIYNDPIWEKNLNSELFNLYKEIYFQKYLEYPRVAINHCSTECASINKRKNDIDIISIGANIEYYHTVNEKTYINSWMKIYNLLVELLEQL